VYVSVLYKEITDENLELTLVDSAAGLDVPRYIGY
jgi:hypothetical protein